MNVYLQLERFWVLYDDRGRPLVNNFRALQHVCGRDVYYRDNCIK